MVHKTACLKLNFATKIMKSKFTYKNIDLNIINYDLFLILTS